MKNLIFLNLILLLSVGSYKELCAANQDQVSSMSYEQLMQDYSELFYCDELKEYVADDEFQNSLAFKLYGPLAYAASNPIAAAAGQVEAMRLVCAHFILEASKNNKINIDSFKNLEAQSTHFNSHFMEVPHSVILQAIKDTANEKGISLTKDQETLLLLSEIILAKTLNGAVDDVEESTLSSAEMNAIQAVIEFAADLLKKKYHVHELSN